MLPSSSGTLVSTKVQTSRQQQQQFSSSMYKNKLKLNVSNLKKTLHVNCTQCSILMF